MKKRCQARFWAILLGDIPATGDKGLVFYMELWYFIIKA